MLGPDEDEDDEVRILNRVIKWTSEGITYEADQRHAELIIEGMDASNFVATPGSRDDAGRAFPPS